MTQQLKVFVKKHPLIDHWLTIARDRHTPVPIFRVAMHELGRWLTYETIRDWLPTQSLSIETPVAVATGAVIDAAIPLVIMPIMKSGLSLLESCQALVPSANIYHFGFTENSAYLPEKLPEQFSAQTRILVLEPMMATGNTIIAALDFLNAGGVDFSLVRIINVICAPVALQKLNQKYPAVQIYSAMIDEKVNDDGLIEPGLGDVGNRAFGF